MRPIRNITIQNLTNSLFYPWNWLMRTSENTAGITLAVLIGVGAGFGAYAFWKLIKFFSWLFFNRGAEWFSFLGDYYVIILPALGGLIFGPLVYFLAREAKGEGPPEIIEAVALRGGRIRARVAAVKIMASSICIGSGGSVGREGPIVQIGGALGSTIGQVLRVPEQWLQTMVLCGVAAGVSATFNAPIAGAFFAMEVIQRRIVSLNVGFIIISSVMASVIARAHLFSEENPTSFSLPHDYALESNQEIAFYFLLGIICAFAATGFVKFFYKTEDIFNKWNPPAYLKPAIGGLIVGGIGFLSLEFVSSGAFQADIFGVGYGAHYGPGGELLEAGPVDNILMGEVGASVVLGLLAFKILATSITLGSGGSGGVFAPSLFMGAAVGSACGSLFGDLASNLTAPTGAYALVGMAAFFAVAVRGPITAILIVFELTGDYEIILPVMTSVVIATTMARVLSKESIYTIRLRRRGIDLRQIEERDVMKTVTVAQVMSRDFPSVPPDMKVTHLLRYMDQTERLGFPVIDPQGHLQGIVTLTDVHAAAGKEGVDMKSLTVDDISTKSPLTAYPDQTLYEVLRELGARDLNRIPVVDRADPTRFLGVLRRHDIVRAYVNAQAKSPPAEVL